MDFKQKYMKYKQKYISLKSMIGGNFESFKNIQNLNEIKILIIKKKDETFYKLTKDKDTIFVKINDENINNIQLYPNINGLEIKDDELKKHIIKIMEQYFDSLKSKMVSEKTRELEYKLLQLLPISDKESITINEKLNKYIVFDELLSDYREKFIKELDEFGKKGDKTCEVIKKILIETTSDRRTRTGPFHINFWKSSELNDPNCILVIIHGKDDNVLINLAEEYNFPRGFPLIWNIGKSLHFYGFYPKFENDALRESVSSNEEFNNISSMNFNFKYSGFLGQVVPFKHNEQYYYTTCGKNYTNYQFSYDLYRIVHKLMTKELIKMLVDENLHICGECMSKFDQHHGARVIEDTFVITMIAKGHKVILTDDKIEILGTPSFDKVTNKNIIQYLSFDKVLEICKKYNLSFDDTYTIHNKEGEKDNVKEFLINLNNNRNFITFTSFNKFIREHSIGIIEGTITHDKVLGDVLEGIIIKIIYKNNTKKTIKYKFPYYTVRTFLLRSMLTEDKKIEGSHTKEFFDNYITSIKQPDEKFYFGEVANYSIRWIVQDENLIGRKFWGYLCSYLYQNFTKIYNLYIDEYIKFIKSYRSEKLPIMLQNILPFYDFHIFAIDYFMNTGMMNFDNTFDYYKNTPPTHKDMMKKIYQESKLSKIENVDTVLDIIFIFGGIGSGKSSIAEHIKNINPIKYKHIDGDILDLPQDRTALLLKEERTGYTLWKIIQTILEGKVPIVTMGGGVLLNIATDFKTYIDSITENKNTINATVIIPSLVQEITKYEFNESLDIDKIFTDNIYKIYHDNDALLKTIKQREWDVRLLDKLSKLNEHNYNTVINLLKSKLRSITRNIILFPHINEQNYGTIGEKALDISREIDSVKQPINFDKINFYFKQKRLLTYYKLDKQEPLYHHITIKFDDKILVNNIELKEFQNYKIKYLYDPISAELCTYNLDSKQNIKFIRVNLPIPEPESEFTKDFIQLITDLNDYAHITVDSLKFPPKYIKDITIGLTNFEKDNTQQIITINNIQINVSRIIKSPIKIIIEDLFYTNI